MFYRLANPHWSRRKQRGAALLLTILVLLGIALGMVATHTQQTVMQAQQLYLQQQRMQRQLDIEGVFSGLADNVAAAPFASSQEALELDGDVEAVGCSHAFDTASRCYQIRVTDRQNSLIRQRTLVVPESCAPPYWYAPLFRSYYFDLTTGGPEIEPITPLPPSLKPK
ncbi:MAG: hypothetical protein C0463_06975 [Idiomarina sp.]|nr:hypothetical protein [Idiomarina sp.]